MSNETKAKTKKTVKTLKNGRKSLQGEYGKVGAPPKEVRWPGRPFTVDQLLERNSTGASAQCRLSLRNKINLGVEAKAILELEPVKQPGGAVGRPKSRFVMAEHYNKDTMTLAKDAVKVKPAKKEKKPRKVKTVEPVVVVETVQVATPPVVIEPVVMTPQPVEVEYKDEPVAETTGIASPVFA